MDDKPTIRLKFSDSSSKPPPIVAVSRAKPPAPIVGSEQLLATCGCRIAFDLYAKDPHRDGRRLKAIGRACPACRQVRAQTEAAAAIARKAKKKQSVGYMFKPRLPNGARFTSTYDATVESWTGTLTIDGAIYEATARSLSKLLHRLDDVYRAALVAAVSAKEDVQGEDQPS